MSTRIVIPLEGPEGIKARIAEHFGRAPYFALAELDDNGVILTTHLIPNTGQHAGGKGYAHDGILQFSPHAVIVRGMGPRGLERLKSAGVLVFQSSAETAQDAILAYTRGELTELTAGCRTARHCHRDEGRDEETHHSL